MKKSNEYNSIMSTVITYYFQSLLKEGDKDPIKTIITEFVNMLEVTKDQEQFILDEAKNFDLNMNDYINVMIKIIQNHKKNINMIKLEDLDDIEDCLNLLSKQIITSTK